MFVPKPGVGPGHYQLTEKLVQRKCMNYTFGKAKLKSCFEEKALRKAFVPGSGKYTMVNLDKGHACHSKAIPTLRARSRLS